MTATTHLERIDNILATIDRVEEIRPDLKPMLVLLRMKLEIADVSYAELAEIARAVTSLLRK